MSGSRIFLYSLVAGLFVAPCILVAIRNSSSVENPSGPCLGSWSGCAIDFGRAQIGQIVKGKLNILNVGNEPLEFSVGGNCSCAELSPTNGIVPPHGLTEVTVGIRMRNEGANELVRVTINTNDPRHPTAAFVLVAHCVAPFNLKPSAIDFGPVPQGASPERIVSLCDEVGAPLSPDTLQFSLLSTDPDVIVTRSAASSLRASNRMSYSETGS
jgi:hypothetical protein